MVRPSILKIGMFGWKKQPQKAVPGAKDFLQYADQKTGSNLHISDRTTSQVDDTIKNLEKEGIPVQGRDHLMFLEDGVKSKEGRRQKVTRKDQSCLCSLGITWLTLQTF